MERLLGRPNAVRVPVRRTATAALEYQMGQTLDGRLLCGLRILVSEMTGHER